MKASDSRPGPGPDPRAPVREGDQARRWREEVMRLDRAALAARLGLDEDAVRRSENEVHVAAEYRLACAALAAGLDHWRWEAVRHRDQDRGKAEQAALLLVRALAHFDRDPHLVRDLLDQASRAIAEARIRAGLQDDGFA